MVATQGVLKWKWCWHRLYLNENGVDVGSIKMKMVSTQGIFKWKWCRHREYLNENGVDTGYI